MSEQIDNIVRIADLSSAEADIRKAVEKLKRAKAPMLTALAHRLAGEIEMAVRKAAMETDLKGGRKSA